MKACFIVTDSNGNSRKFKLANDEYVTIGRSKKNCQVVINDQLSSSIHSKLTVEDDKVTIEDLNSKNGTYVNGLKILRQRVYLDDRIIIGESTLTFDFLGMDSETKNKLKHKKGAARVDGASMTLALETAAQRLQPNQGLSTSSRQLERIRNHVKKKPLKKNESPEEYIKRSKLFRGVDDNKARYEDDEKDTIIDKILSKLAEFLNIVFALLFGAISFFSVYIIEPKLAAESFHPDKIKVTGFLDSMLSLDLMLYHFIAIAMAYLFHKINYRLKNGTLAHRLLKSS